LSCGNLKILIFWCFGVREVAPCARWHGLLTRRNFIWEGSYLARKADTLSPFRTLSNVSASPFLIINPTRDFIYNDTIGITIHLAVQTVSY
jgi:hypothetical protein